MEKGIYTLLAEAQGEMKPPKKDKTGQVGPRKYEYASLDAVLASVKPPLNARGIFLTQKTASHDDQLVMQTVVATDEVQLVLDEQPYEYDQNPQELGKRETYAKRYSLCKAFAIVGDEDTDGDVQAKEPAKKAPNAMRMIAGLKMQAMELGVKEDGINAWYEAKFGKTPMNRLDKRQTEELVGYLRKIIADAKSIKEGEGDEHQ